MKKLILITKIIAVLVFLSSCQSINEKSDAITKKENKELSKFIGQPVSELIIVMGDPSEETKNNKGAKILVYKKKKYGISCERKFEVNDLDMIVGFSSKGCF
tara:strand:+ start:156 stop:461 length:306 start_codon:yes stop_codon:yes gene_type:complete